MRGVLASIFLSPLLHYIIGKRIHKTLKSLVCIETISDFVLETGICPHRPHTHTYNSTWLLNGPILLTYPRVTQCNTQEPAKMPAQVEDMCSPCLLDQEDIAWSESLTAWRRSTVWSFSLRRVCVKPKSQDWEQQYCPAHQGNTETIHIPRPLTKVLCNPFVIFSDIKQGDVMGKLP